MNDESKLNDIEVQLRNILAKIRNIPEEDLLNNKSLSRLLSVSGNVNNILLAANKEKIKGNKKTLKEIIKIIEKPLYDMGFYHNSYKDDYCNIHFTKNVENLSKMITISISYEDRFQIHLNQALNLDRDDISNPLLYVSFKILNVNNSENPEENAKIVLKQIKSMLIEFNQKNLKQVLEIQEIINEIK